LRLDYLDGIRGLAALYVVLGHIYVALMFLVPEVQVAPALADAMKRMHVDEHLARGVMALVTHGFALPAVQVFIVLSGYCLMLPVARAEGVQKGGFTTFMRRRAIRILPPYFAMLAVSMAISVFMNQARLVQPPVDDLHWDTVFSHLFVIHNWSQRWHHAFDPPMWSIAVEWQIYFTFPLLLLPIWHRFGNVGCVAAAFALAVVPHVFMNGYLDWSRPWFVGLFALGMAAADVNFSKRSMLQNWHDRLPWGWISFALWALVVAAGVLKAGLLSSNAIIADGIVGLATMSLLVSCTRALKQGRAIGKHPALSLLMRKPVVGLGIFSYSTYLVHYPLMALFFYATRRIEMSIWQRTALMYGCFLPLVLAFAFGFYLVFERPFMLYRSKRDAKPDTADASAAPASARAVEIAR